METILKVVKDGLCTGCGTCVAICPKDAIDIVVNKERGVYLPQLNNEKCVNCGLCHRVCPGHEVDFKTLNSEIFGKESESILTGNYLNCYTGHTTSYNIKYNASSGGLITSILIFALETKLISGAIVTRMNQDNPLEPEPFIARTKDEIISASKSKYCPVPVNIILKEVINAKNGEKFAVVGLPCHIHGLRKAQSINSKLRDKIVLCLGLFCAHEDSFLATEFLLNKFGIKENDVRKIEYRGRGWPGSMSIELYTGGMKIIPYKNYIRIFHSYNFFTPKRCLLCSDATCELADISFGEAWDLPETKKSDTGFSILINRTKYGELILQDAENSGDIKLTGTNIENVVISQRGLIYTKKIGFRLRIAILRLVGKKLPDFNIYLPKNSIMSIGAILPYINACISDNKWTLKLIKYVPDNILCHYGSMSNVMAYLWIMTYMHIQKR